MFQDDLNEKKMQDYSEISNLVQSCFAKVAPFWPLQNLIAVNPLQGFEDFPIEDALKAGATYFEQIDLPQKMEAVNIATIKWLQLFFDEGQATIVMPFKKEGLYSSWSKLAPFDDKLHKGIDQDKNFLNALPKSPNQAILECLSFLRIDKQEREQFLILLIATLPGWASYIKYYSQSDTKNGTFVQLDYIAMRIIIVRLLWPDAKNLLDWHQQKGQNVQNFIFEKIEAVEKPYRVSLLSKISKQDIQKLHRPEAQLVFCIDVRCESFRKKLELTGDYQTLGFAGFFGVPAQITDAVTGHSYASCPVLIKPKHEVKEFPCKSKDYVYDQKGYELQKTLKLIYQSMKYTFVAPFALVESLGLFSGIWMGLRCFAPIFASKFKNRVVAIIRKPKSVRPSLENISFQEQCAYAQNALRMMGLVDNFASIVVFCGHGSKTENNAYATALDCGACAGRHGGSSARILAAIMNRSEIREQLAKDGIIIPKATCFIAAEHNTTTDEVAFYEEPDTEEIKKLKRNIEIAGQENSASRLKKMEQLDGGSDSAKLRSQDWSQVRPELGLARNAGFIIAPRDLTSFIDLDGRCFLHSYDYKQDPQGLYLETILTAPMVVAQWINMQYLFSTINNVSYGGGSKVTKNITGKIGVMQGNASDLMTGLPLQSVYSSDTVAYHEPQRLVTILFAPRVMLDKIINRQPLLKKLFGNGWVTMSVIEPDDRKVYLLNRDFSWQEIN